MKPAAALHSKNPRSAHKGQPGNLQQRMGAGFIFLVGAVFLHFLSLDRPHKSTRLAATMLPCRAAGAGVWGIINGEDDLRYAS